jgi:hypothetical protein
MLSVTKLATSSLLALALTASSLNVAPASASDRGAGLAIGIGAGLIIGGILLNQQRNHHPHRHGGPQAYFGGGYDPYGNVGYQPACYLGPVQYRWVEDCRQGNHGDLFCHKTQQAYQQKICN